jgi:exodeoxyribonuclease VII small subunit
MAKKTDADAAQPGFEEALERLETIVDELESGSLTLEDSIARYEEGMKLSRTLSATLDAAEKRIERLVEGAGGPETEPADLEDDSAPAAPAAPAAPKPARAAVAKRPAPDDDPSGRLPF